MKLSTDSQGGFGALETALTAPVVLMLIALLMVAGRASDVTNSLDTAAYAAARAASLERDPGQARAVATRTAQASLVDGRTRSCKPVVQVDTAGFATAVGTPAQVGVRISCEVPLADLTALPGLPGTRTMTASALSAIDAFRGRS